MKKRWQLMLAMIALMPAVAKAEQTNVQLLKGMTDQELQRTMNMMRGSLGVHCDFCHVTEEGKGWDFSKDDKQPKKTARTMIKMVMDLNKNNFEGQPRISCFTCHQGATRPNGIISLPQTAPPFPTVVPARVTPDMPSAEQVLDKYVEALGGQAAIDRLTSRAVKGTAVTWDKKELAFESVQTAPGRFFMQTVAPQGPIQRAFDGKSGWFKGPRGVVRDLNPAESAEASRAADLFAEIKLKERYPGLKLIGKQSVNDRDAWILMAVGPNGKVERFLFDAQSALLVRHVTMSPTAIGMVPEQEDFEDYRDVDGLKEPFKLTSSFVDPWIGQTLRISEVSHNVAVDASKFQRPPDAPKP